MTMAPSLRPLLILWTACAVLFSFSPAMGLALLGFSAWKFSDSYREVGRQIQFSDTLGTYGLSLGLFVFVMYWLMQLPAPSDDLLRHIPGAAYGYSHPAIYPHSSFPDVNLYPTFEIAVGALTQVWGPIVTVQVVMGLAWAFAFLLAWGLVRESGATLSAGASVLLCLLFTTSLSSRLFLGRPEIFGVLWALSALLCKRHWSLVLWVAGGALFSTSYWLFPLYLVTVLLLPFGRKTQFLVATLLGLFHVGFWSWHAGSLTTYIDIIRLIPVWTEDRLMSVMETESIWQMFAQPSTLVLTLLGLAGMSKLPAERRLALCLVGFAVLMTNMVRYAAVIALLMFVAALPLVPMLNELIRKHFIPALLVLVLPTMTAGELKHAAVPLSELPAFSIPAGATVLTGFNTATFAVPFFNPGKVKVIPAMELGATEKPYQLAAKAVNHGKLACSDIEGLTITHVVENSQRTMPACLKLAGVQGQWRLWEVRHGR